MALCRRNCVAGARRSNWGTHGSEGGSSGTKGRTACEDGAGRPPEKPQKRNMLHTCKPCVGLLYIFRQRRSNWGTHDSEDCSSGTKGHTACEDCAGRRHRATARTTSSSPPSLIRNIRIRTALCKVLRKYSPNGPTGPTRAPLRRCCTLTQTLNTTNDNMRDAR